MGETGDTPRYGLRDLGQVPLPPEKETALARLDELGIGLPFWRSRRRKEARELFALEEISSGRMTLLALDCRTELRAVVRLDVAVPTLPPGAPDLLVHRGADLALVYPQTILSGPLPGMALVRILWPQAVFHPNVSADAAQALCLGVNVPRNYPLREAVLASYAALALQNVTVDERSPQGVANAEAARWWQDNMERMPLMAEPFLGAARGEVPA